MARSALLQNRGQLNVNFNPVKLRKAVSCFMPLQQFQCIAGDKPPF